MASINILQDNLILNQIQSRLKKYSFLSKNSSPGYADAYILVLIKISGGNNIITVGIPDRQKYQFIFHWYIMMLQFSVKCIQKWFSKDIEKQDDLILEITKKYKLSKDKTSVEDNKQYEKQQFTSSPIKRVKSFGYQQLKLRKKSFTTEISSQVQYVMALKLKQDLKVQPQEIRSKLSQQRINLTKFAIMTQNPHQMSITINFKIQPMYFESFKDKVCKWAQVEILEVKKQKKIQSKISQI